MNGINMGSTQLELKALEISANISQRPLNWPEIIMTFISMII